MFKVQFQIIYSYYFKFMLWTDGTGLGASAIHPPPLTSCPLLKLTLTFAEELALMSLAGSRHFRIGNMNWLTKSIFD